MARRTKTDEKQAQNGSTTCAQNVPDVKEGLKKMNSGRRTQPKRVTEKHLEKLWSQIAAGKGMAAVCADQKNKLPSRATVINYLSKNPEAKDYINEAYEWHARHMAEFIMNVSEGGDQSSGSVERDKLIVSTARFLMSKYNRRDFGEQVNVAVQSDGPAIILPAGFGSGVLSGTVIDAAAIEDKRNDDQV